MPTRNISLTDRLDGFVENVVASGEYQNASEVVRDALRLLALRREEEAHKIERLRQIAAGATAAYERGEYRELSAEDIPAYTREIQRRGIAKRRGASKSK